MTQFCNPVIKPAPDEVALRVAPAAPPATAAVAPVLLVPLARLTVRFLVPMAVASTRPKLRLAGVTAMTELLLTVPPEMVRISWVAVELASDRL